MISREAVAVAVVMPAYNAEKFLREAISSVLAQSFPNLHLVLIDDGSRDSTRAIALSILDPRLQVLALENGGPARARNAGVDAAPPARFLAFCDADDIWDPGKLEEQIQFMESNPALGGVGCFMRYVSPTGKQLGGTGQTLDDAALQLVRLGKLAPFPTSSLLIRRELFGRAGRFDESFRYPGSEDLDFLSRLAQVGSLQCVPKTLGSYRIHAQSAMGRERLRILMEARFVEQRISRRLEGGDLTWTEFVASYQPTWNERRANWRQVLYRSAAVHHAEGNRLRALGFGMVGLLLAPVYTLKRLARQTVGSRFTRRDPPGWSSTPRPTGDIAGR